MLTGAVLVVGSQLCFPRVSVAAPRAGDKVTLEYLDGTKKIVVIGRLDRDYIFVKHSTGGYNIFANWLSDKTLKELGMTNEIFKREEKRRKRKFEDEQLAKGLVRFKDQWLTPGQANEMRRQEEEEKREKEYNAYIHALVMDKHKENINFKVLQAMTEGLLCIMGEWNNVLHRYVYTGEGFYLPDASNKTIADDDRYQGDLYWCGTYIYTTVKGDQRTVNRYSTDLSYALLLAREHMQDPDSKVTVVPHVDSDQKTRVTYHPYPQTETMPNTNHDNLGHNPFPMYKDRDSRAEQENDWAEIQQDIIQSQKRQQANQKRQNTLWKEDARMEVDMAESAMQQHYETEFHPDPDGDLELKKIGQGIRYDMLRIEIEESTPLDREEIEFRMDIEQEHLQH